MDCKIIVTIGPSSINKNILNKLNKAGASSFRINLSHSDKESLETYYQTFKSCNIKPSIDTQGAQVRISALPSKTLYREGERVSISHMSNINNIGSDLKINHPEFFAQLDIGDLLKIGFDGLTANVISLDKLNNNAILNIKSEGIISVNKAIDIADKPLLLAPLSEFDKYVLSNSYKNEVETIYLSFCNNVNAISEVSSIINDSYQSKSKKPKIIAKIETKAAILNLKEIAEKCDGILIDRGDLSREVRISKIPSLVNFINDKCIELNKPCYVATNILEQMIQEKLPSRAEISDIYNLLSKGVSGIVLAAEVAIGKNPVECVQIIKYMSNLQNNEKAGKIVSLENDLTFPGLPNHLKAWL